MTIGLGNIKATSLLFTPYLICRHYTKKIKKMPPKSKNADPNKILLGRPGNNLKMGLVGLPNVGKSTFFNALTNSSV